MPRVDDKYKPVKPDEVTDEALAPGWWRAVARDVHDLVELVRDGLKPAVDETRAELRDHRADLADMHASVTRLGAQVETLSANLRDTKTDLEARVRKLEVEMALRPKPRRVRKR